MTNFTILLATGTVELASFKLTGAVDNIFSEGGLIWPF